MIKYKEHPRVYVVSIRVSDEERSLLMEITKRNNTTISMVLRDAMSEYTSMLRDSTNGG